MSRAFAPILGANGGGAIVNVLSVLSWLSMPQTAMYSAAKAAAWSLTNSWRVELAGQGTLVVGVHVGFMDTDMAAAVEAPKVSPESVVEATLEALRTGQHEVLADDASRFVKSQLSSDLEALYPSLVAVVTSVAATDPALRRHPIRGGTPSRARLRRHRARHVHGVARPVDRQRRLPRHRSVLPRRQFGIAVVDHHRLLDRVRRAARGRRPHRRPARPQAHVPGRRRRVPDRLVPVRHRPERR